MSQNLSSAAVEINALRIKTYGHGNYKYNIVTKQKCLNKLIQEINNNVCLLVCLSKNTDSL